MSEIFNNEFLEMYSGNMPLEMSHVSGVYKGAVGVSSVLFPNRNAPDLYNQAYTFTRAQVDNSRAYQRYYIRRQGCAPVITASLSVEQAHAMCRVEGFNGFMAAIVE